MTYILVTIEQNVINSMYMFNTLEAAQINVESIEDTVTWENVPNDKNIWYAVVDSPVRYEIWRLD